MPSICFYFQVHQPLRIKPYKVFDVGNDPEYFNDASDNKTNNKLIMEKVSNKSYLPTNKLLLELLNRHPEFKVSFSLSGVFLEQLEDGFPEVLKSFQDLVKTGRAEILSETYYHSLSFLYSKDEFRKQVELHKQKIWDLFEVEPQVFRNTELIFNNELAQEAEAMGYKGVIAEGADHILDWRSPNFVYRSPGTKNIKLLLKNYKLSDDIAFRFSDKGWAAHPLLAETFSSWVSDHNGAGNLINLFMDYETFGEHQWEDTGIFKFLENLPNEVLKNPDNDFVTPSEAIAKYDDFGEIDFPHYVSWADEERDLSAWLSNDIQRDSMEKIYAMEKNVLETKDEKLIKTWRRLQTSDHFYYMCTKFFNDGDVHKYFSPYDTPYDAFINFMNALNDLKIRVNEKLEQINKKGKKKVIKKAVDDIHEKDDGHFHNPNFIIELNKAKNHVIDLRKERKLKKVKKM
ncbi:MAG: glycoside hydrolase family 57 protein [Patescibacteria group bacterium]|jgi:alpha-amylase|nr:glycoside hydrolase family 57 protein [Patescibacteria group bacterium]